MTTHSKHTSHKFEYISNPFSSSFKGMSRLFERSQTAAIVVLVISVISAISNSMSSFPTESNEVATQTSTTSAGASLPVGAVAFLGIFILALTAGIIFLTVLLTGIVNYIAWKNSRDEEAQFGDAVRATLDNFWKILLIMLITTFKIIGGFLLLIVPGVRAALRYQMVYMAMFDENLSAKESISRIKFLTKGHLMEMFGILSVSQLLLPVSLLVQIGGQSILYPQLKHIKDNKLPSPPTHWANYISIIILAAIILFAIGLIVLITAAARY